jgi:dinuclear metal center YbgI/SA1388 family protein
MNDNKATVRDVTQHLENIAPLHYQESYDNAGLIVGDSQMTVTGVLLTLDCTEAVVEEAIAKNCNLIVAHHPIVFKGLKKLNGRNYIERTVIKAIKNDVAIYAIHTNLDNIMGGVNSMIAEKLGLKNTQILAPKAGVLSKLVTFVPTTHTQALLGALHTAGAGQIGNYDQCSFKVTGTGSFKPNATANPFIGDNNTLTHVSEDRIEVIFPNYLQSNILATLQTTHPYEEVAYYLSVLNNEHQEVGAGVVGELPEAINTHQWLLLLKKQMNLPVVKHTAIVKDKVVRIAVCGGSGSFLLNDAIRAQADVFVTADYKYHEFFDADKRLVICDIGHYESEVCTKELLHRFLSKKFITFAIILSETNTNPVNYLL